MPSSPQIAARATAPSTTDGAGDADDLREPAADGGADDAPGAPEHGPARRESDGEPAARSARPAETTSRSTRAARTPTEAASRPPGKEDDAADDERRRRHVGSPAEAPGRSLAGAGGRPARAR